MNNTTIYNQHIVGADPCVCPTRAGQIIPGRSPHLCKMAVNKKHRVPIFHRGDYLTNV